MTRSAREVAAQLGGGKSLAHAGEVYSAEALRGRRFVKIEQVRGLDTAGVQPYVICHEVMLSGEGGVLHWKKARGALRGVDRGLSFNVSLVWDGQHYKMPAAYRREEIGNG